MEQVNTFVKTYLPIEDQSVIPTNIGQNIGIVECFLLPNDWLVLLTEPFSPRIKRLIFSMDAPRHQHHEVDLIPQRSIRLYNDKGKSEDIFKMSKHRWNKYFNEFNSVDPVNSDTLLFYKGFNNLHRFMRVKINGKMDTSFGHKGIVDLYYSSNGDDPLDQNILYQLLEDGSLIILSKVVFIIPTYDSISKHFGISILKLNQNGFPETGFGDNGYVCYYINNNLDLQPISLADYKRDILLKNCLAHLGVQNDLVINKINGYDSHFINIWVKTSSNPEVDLIIRLYNTGTPVPHFGNGNKGVLNLDSFTNNNEEKITQITNTSDGKLVVVNYSKRDMGESVVDSNYLRDIGESVVYKILLFDTYGKLDISEGNSGILTINADGIDIDSFKGRIYFENLAKQQFECFNFHGELDHSVFNNGILYLNDNIYNVESLIPKSDNTYFLIFKYDDFPANNTPCRIFNNYVMNLNLGFR